ncbi:transport protein (probable substrate cadmium) (plasmid) [Natrialba magadii ATCC 43099]|uniref:Cadmium transporter n=1 Tax=Natrialba magadii (strain ATCC 43099 / DSM 3394 / CCM 3739 / CIP 104546 / IAM 13178 / JCM 8861 / NBRC 102185 / NCIMB 2190 / MS3) TaxID=547559 RepID=D3T1Y5_NATMM|nr:cadmium resistance transporter [Natrialba magadii]ADD07594.2 transport protein (probable substrate cadmium) [Natrialba magadii ATCC 43099]ELY27069.1 cadmium transporter [Natrialba magadii ATCC 43099]
METVLFVALWLFIVTHIDTLLVISAFCADNDYQLWEVLVGHYVSFCIGLSAAVVGAIVAAELLYEWTFLLGVVPLTIGLWGLISRPPETTIEELPAVPNSVGRIGVVTVAGIGLSGENIAVFVPFFADLGPGELQLIVIVYLIAAGIVFLTALLLVYRVAIDGISDRLDRWLVPTVLVIVGGYVIVAGLTVA